MTGRDLLKDRSLKPVKIAESDIDVSEQRDTLTPHLPPDADPGWTASGRACMIL